MERWSFKYALFKPLAQLAFWLSHKRVTVIGKENIPKGKAIIFAPNHQNALMDPMSVSCTISGQPVWLARADIFQSDIKSSILRSLKILPIYRIRDGKIRLKKNDTIFDISIRVLENKNAIALFPEAAHSGKNQMLPHKKLVARIAFQAEEKNDFNLGLIVIPVGIHYSHLWHFNRKVTINYGQPIEVSNYKEFYIKDKQRARAKLKKDLFSAIEKLTIEIKSKENYDNFELMRSWANESISNPLFNRSNKLKQQFNSHQINISRLESGEQNNQEGFNELHQKLNLYRSFLEEKNISDKLFEKKNRSSNKFIGNLLIAIIFSPALFVGFIVFLIPFLIPRWYIQHKVKDHTFLSTFQFVSGLITHLLFVIGLLILLTMNGYHIFMSIAIIIGLFIIGKLGYSAYKSWSQFFKLVHFRLERNKSPLLFFEMEELRQHCIKQVKNFLVD